MRIRVITGLLGIPLILGISYLGGTPFTVAVFLLTILAAAESSRLLAAMGQRSWGVLALLGPVLILLASIYQLEMVAVVALIYGGGLLVLAMARRGPTASLFAGMGLAVFIAAYLGVSFSLWIKLRALPGGFWLLLAAMLVTWANDTAAFFVGTRIGRRRLAPLISPNKSVEGAVAGLLGGLCLGAACGHALGVGLLAGLCLGGLGAVGAQAGDLFISALKRAAGVKDTGRLIPGHGGVLDRFDSLSFVVPLFYLIFFTGVL